MPGRLDVTNHHVGTVSVWRLALILQPQTMNSPCLSNSIHR